MGRGAAQLSQVDFYGTGDAAECEEVIGVLVHQVKRHAMRHAMHQIGLHQAMHCAVHRAMHQVMHQAVHHAVHRWHLAPPGGRLPAWPVRQADQAFPRHLLRRGQLLLRRTAAAARPAHRHRLPQCRRLRRRRAQRVRRAVAADARRVERLGLAARAPRLLAPCNPMHPGCNAMHPGCSFHVPRLQTYAPRLQPCVPRLQPHASQVRFGCFSGLYISGLMQHEYGFPRASKRLAIAHTLRGAKVEWALGRHAAPPHRRTAAPPHRRHAGTQAHRHTGTQAHRHAGTRPSKHAAPKLPSTRPHRQLQLL